MFIKLPQSRHKQLAYCLNKRRIIRTKGRDEMRRSGTKAIILKGQGSDLAYWKPARRGRRAFRFDGMFTRETSLTFARASVPAANYNATPMGLHDATNGEAALIFLNEIVQRRGA
jgi:hypothetical protein